VSTNAFEVIVPMSVESDEACHFPNSGDDVLGDIMDAWGDAT
jgi:hypothetical protein